MPKISEEEKLSFVIKGICVGLLISILALLLFKPLFCGTENFTGKDYLLKNPFKKMSSFVGNIKQKAQKILNIQDKDKDKDKK
tara:strand:+ start:638 stop:886 length:249 start_codon:yes stop_codon:yes gene_type:complete